MPLDAAPNMEKNQTVSGPRRDNSVDLKRLASGMRVWARHMPETRISPSHVATPRAETTSPVCDCCHKMLRKLHSHTTRDIIQMKTRRCPYKVAQILACQALGKKINLSLDLESSTG